MTNKMLIDASHQEETRVVVVKGSRIEEFDFESEHKKQLKGNIYLAKVTRVEPSLQAAFVEYGGNRHGFLAFSEIHPDYYQIPVADRQALIEEELAHAARDEDEDEVERPAKPARGRGRRPRGEAKAADTSEGESVSEPAEGDDVADVETEASDRENGATELTGDAEGDTENSEASETAENSEERTSRGRRRGRGRRRSGDSRVETVEDEDGHDEEPEEVDQIGAEDAMEEIAVRQVRPRKQYKIQEVIKRRQIILVQVVKEERGNKGAALTTYLSLAGRYSVLMPNTARGGGISRKITSATDRKRLKELVRDLEVPKGMGIILRTAGANRTKPEIKRDYEYLMRLWETVRTLTLGSTAPALVYEEGSLIKRSIRDLYNKDIEQILVAGERGYREAKDFMRMLLPSQAKVVQPYRETAPIFARAGIEAQLDKMLQPNVTLKSGGYIIINQTEALVAIDVNSGRSTREHSIEDTAYQTNLEAAEEVARQLRLRDLAGLIVIDFIDMEEKRNNRAVEKRLKDCLKDDRARIQLGRISHFGLMEMSRQRIRASVLESTMQTCPVCNGNGFIRSASSLALHALRSIEEHLQKYGTHDITVRVPTATALYILNEKRQTIEDLERSHGLRITLAAEEGHGLQHVSIENGAEAVRRPKPAPVNAESVPIDIIEDEEADEAAAAIEVDDETEASTDAVDVADTETEAEREEGRRRRRRRRGRRRDGTEGEARGDDASSASDDEDGDAVAEGDEDAISGSDESADDADAEAGRERKRRRRGRRGGRRNREEDEMTIASDTPVMDVATGESAPRGRLDDAFETAAERSPDPEMTDAVTAFDADYASQAGSQEASHAALAPDENEILAASAEAGASTDEIRPLDEVFPYEEDAAAESDENVRVEEQAAADQPDSATRAPREDDDTASSGAEAQPKRTGWWSRRFG